MLQKGTAKKRGMSSLFVVKMAVKKNASGYNNEQGIGGLGGGMEVRGPIGGGRRTVSPNAQSV